MVRLYAKSTVDRIVSHLEPVTAKVRETAEVVGERASGLLEEVKASTHWHNIGNPASTGHRYQITTSHGETDSFVNLEGPNPLAMEFGHEPSGYYAGTDTRAPHGTYVLTHATGFTDLSH